ncbi:MAG TPA: transketolase C-terminal domain-containing protein [Solirubrobacterales bacterium]|nr:transketolase C-terminal domain-containing protein [Solirubrobacterales bacterium]
MANIAGTKRDLERSWSLTDLLDQAPGFAALSSTLIEITEAGAPVVALTADLKYSNGLVRYGERFPQRFFNMGISEQNMVTAAAAMATTGLTPFVSDFASFLSLLCCEQIRMDLAYSKLPVRMIGHHAGIALGFYGTSHHATEDLSVLRVMAGLTVVCPADPASLAAAIRASVEWREPIYIRIGRGREPEVYADGSAGFEIGKAIKHFDGASATVIATGSMVHPSLVAVNALRDRGHDVGLIDMHTIKPFDRDAVLEAASASELILTVEEHNRIGGLGAAVGEVLAEAEGAPPLRRHGIADEYSLIGPPTHLYRHYGLDVAGIEKFVRLELEAIA